MEKAVIIHLTQDVLKTLGKEAIMQGTNRKVYIQEVLKDKAKKLNDKQLK